MSVSRPERRLLTSEEAADYCGFDSINGFLSYIDVPAVKFGKLVRYDRRDLDDFLDQLRQPNRLEFGFAELAGRNRIVDLAGAHQEPRAPTTYTPDSLAERWNCSAHHVRNLINRGELGHTRLGRRIFRISSEQVEAYERDNDTTKRRT